jgi:HEAT repeats
VIAPLSIVRDSWWADLGRLRLGHLEAVAAAIILIISTTPVFAAHAHVLHADASSADAVVEKLRELPLPMRTFSNELPSGKATPAPLPALESRRQQVYAELHALGSASVPALARALRDPDTEMRRNVAVALDVVGGGWWHFPDGDAKLDLRPALPALLSALRDSDPGVRAWAAQDLGDIGAAAGMAVPRLRAMLHSPDAESRGTACNALGAIGLAARGALPDLRGALDDSSPEVRQAAGAAIARIDRAAALH